jgi:predicted RND superfamily exporter protein
LRERLAERFADFVTGRPLVVLAVAAVLAGIAWPSVRDLPLRTGRLELAPANEPSVVEYRAFNRAFGAGHTVFVIASGPGGEVRACVARVADALSRRRDHVRSAICRLDVAQLEAQALAGARSEELRELDALLARNAVVWDAVVAEPHVERCLKVLVDELTDDEAPAPAVAEALALVRALAGGLRAAERALRGDPGAARELDPGARERERFGVDEDGYFVSRDRGRGLVVVSPAYAVDDPESAGQLLSVVREEAERVRAASPSVEIAYAGAPVQDVEEQSTVTRDMVRTALVAYACVLLLSFVAFRNIFVAVRSNVVLALAVYFALALANVLVGQLNIISSVFVAVLVGLGDDFGIYLFTMYREAVPEHGRGAMRFALASALRGLSTGAFTVAAAFLALRLQGFRAFQELGVIAGAGILVAFACMVAVLPALIAWMHDRFPIGVAVVVPRGRGVLTSAVMRHPRAVVAAGLVIVAVASVGMPRVGFDYRLSDLQASSSASVRAEAMLAADFGLSSDFVVVRSTSLPEAAAAAARLRACASVGAVSGIADLVLSRPPDAVALAKLAVRAESMRAPVRPAAGWPTPDAEAVRSSLEALPAGLKKLADLARMQESSELAAALEEAERARQAAWMALASVTVAEGSRRLASLTEPLAAVLARYRGVLLRARAVRPYGIETLPAELRDRFVGNDGTLATYAWPRGPLDGRERMSAFVADVTSVPGRVSGLPVMVFRMLELIRDGLLRAALPALVVILVMVWLDFGRIGSAALALVPMAAGTVTTVGLMGWAGASWNAVSSIALPVMLGVGVDYGVNLVHRWRSNPDAAEILAGAGRAILYAGATSVLGFGSLVLADHRGLQSFGRTMALGTAVQMFFALAVVPALLALRAPRKP